ncbi:MAG: hypothetical protein V4501_07900 [Pseudomonadota bacterium]
MLKTKTRLISTLTGLFALLASSMAAAHINVDLNIGLSAPPPLPPAHVVVVGPPSGYRTCYMTQGMWFNDVWVPAHQQCEYAGSAGPSVWVSGYWGCLDVGPSGRCGQWRWYNRHMIRGDVAYIHSGHPGYNHEGPAYAHARYRDEAPHYVNNHYREEEAPHYVNNRYRDYQRGHADAVVRDDHENHDSPVYGRGPY